jgi:hypothetical protein
MGKPTFNTGFCYPYDLIENLPRFPIQHAIPCSVLYNNDTKGGILLICPPSDLRFFGIDPSTKPEPYLRFRMLNIDQNAFVIEIHLGFDNDRILKIHLSPAVPQTIEFLKLCSETKTISFHYYNRSKKTFVSSITGLDDDHVDWFKRNYELAKKLSPVNDYLKVCRELIHEMKSNHRLYDYFEMEGIDCFIREGSIVAKFDDTKESFPMAGQKKMWN